MDLSFITSTVLPMMGVLGGVETIKYFLNRKPNARIVEAEADIKEAEADIKAAEADSAELKVLKDTVVFLQEQMKRMAEDKAESDKRHAEQIKMLSVENAEKEKRFIEQTNRLREVQDREFKVMQENAALKLENQMYKCVRKKCDNREPKNGY